MEHTGYEQLLIERRGKVLRVTLNAPDKLNAIGFAMESELLRLFQDLRRDRHTASSCSPAPAARSAPAAT